MNIQEYKFPKSDDYSAIFTDKKLLAESKLRGFYNGKTEYNKMFSELFFKGGKVIFKNDLDETFKNECWSYYKVFVSSFQPSHQEKEAICAMLLSELVDGIEKK